MANNSTIFGVIGAIAVILFLGGGQLFSSIVDQNTRIITWNGYETKITSSSEFKTRPCDGYSTIVGGFVIPNDDANNSALSIISTATIDRACASDASASADITILHAESYKSIFIPLSGQASSGGSRQNMRGEITGTLYQEGGESVVLFNKLADTGNFNFGSNPQNILLQFQNGYINIPSIGAIMRMNGDYPLHLRLNTMVDRSSNLDSARAEISLQPFEVVKIQTTSISPSSNSTSTTSAQPTSNTSTQTEIPLITPIIEYFFEEETGTQTSSTTTQPTQTNEKTFPLFEIVLVILIIAGAIIFARWMKWI